MQVLNRKKTIGYSPNLYGEYADRLSLAKIDSGHSDVSVYELHVPKEYTDKVVQIKWKIKAIGVKGSWSSNAILDKRFKTDWEMPQIESSISIDAPILSLYGHHDENVICFGVSDPVNVVRMEAALREEDNHFYCTVHFLNEVPLTSDYKIKLYINESDGNFSHIIQHTSQWIMDNSLVQNREIPQLATKPLYSTWYSFHQNLIEKELIAECTFAKDLGYELVIIDDGWQTKDDNRGYDYTGDWKSERFDSMADFVSKVHDIGMGVMLWYSVPFCGVKSEAYRRFKGKFLTENHHWAPVFDPRCPDVRSYLVEIYIDALKEWNIDGFKLDFIDDFKVYPETELQDITGRDTLSVSEGVSKLIHEISSALYVMKKDVLIEFRQKYISPALHSLGNMFRAFDCPNDSLMNRVRITDVKLICGQAAVHSDMITWHREEPVDVAALQFTSLIFSVPQLSVKMLGRSTDEKRMIKYYTNYWLDHSDILLNGEFSAYKPLSNYPYLSSAKGDTIIYGLYEDVIIPIDTDHASIHIVNGKLSESVYLESQKTSDADWQLKVVDCLGKDQCYRMIKLNKSITKIECPANGIIFLNRK